MNRRDMLKRTGAAALALGLGQVSGFPLGWASAADGKRRRILMYTKSEGFQHACVERKDGKLSLAENVVKELGDKHNFEAVCTKDGRVFVNEDLSQYDAFLFETQGDLFKEGRDKEPPMTPEGKQAFLKAVASGKGFVGCHCASDTFHSPGPRNENQPAEKRDPYIAMLGGEFIVHGEQQKARMRVADSRFPGLSGLEDFELLEEWYALKNFAPDLHVILVQETQGMKVEGRNAMYNRANFPATWARRHERGRVFYTSMGHRDDVWTSPVFHQVLLGGLGWAVGNVDADVTPNFEKVTPQAAELKKA